jgi:hypothetical protein
VHTDSPVATHATAQTDSPDATHAIAHTDFPDSQDARAHTDSPDAIAHTDSPVAAHATAHAHHTCDGFGAQRAFSSFWSVLGHRFVVLFFHLDFVSPDF